MRRMMTLTETAEALGVTNRTIYRTIKRTGMRWRLQRHHAAYRFTNDDVIALAHVLDRRNVGYLTRTLTPNSYVHDATHAT